MCSRSQPIRDGRVEVQSAIRSRRRCLDKHRPTDAAHALDVALADPWLQSQSVAAIVIPVEVVRPGDGKTFTQVWFADYTGRRTFVLSLSEGDTTVVDRATADFDAANYSPAEKAAAVAIAMGDTDVKSRSGGAELVVNNITGGSGSACKDTRCLAVFLTPPDKDYRDLLVATVDLVERRVVDIIEGQ